MFWKRNRLIASIVEDKCENCGCCVRICRHNVLESAIVHGENRTFIAYPDLCTGCGKCMIVCLNQAIKMIEK